MPRAGHITTASAFIIGFSHRISCRAKAVGEFAMLKSLWFVLRRLVAAILASTFVLLFALCLNIDSHSISEFFLFLRRSVNFHEAHSLPGNVMGLMLARKAVDSAKETANRLFLPFTIGKLFIHFSFLSLDACIACIQDGLIFTPGSARASV